MLAKSYLAVLALGSFHAHGANLMALCYSPSRPYCLESTDITDSCKYEVDGYLKELNDYLNCVTDPVLSEKKKVIEEWNCRARGGSLSACLTF